MGLGRRMLAAGAAGAGAAVLFASIRVGAGIDTVASLGLSGVIVVAAVAFGVVWYASAPAAVPVAVRSASHGTPPPPR